MTNELENGGTTQLQGGVQVGSGEGPVFERFAPARSATTDPSLDDENKRILAMMSPALIEQYKNLPPEQRLATPTRVPRSGVTEREDTEPVDGPKLAENQVLLKDGRVVSVMETSPRHDSAVEKLLGQAGLTLTGLGAVGYQRAMALCALDEVGRYNPETGQVEDIEPLAVPRTKLMWEERQDYINRTADALKIVAVYNRINGNSEE
jgi:hypothetical protein